MRSLVLRAETIHLRSPYICGFWLFLRAMQTRIMKSSVPVAFFIFIIHATHLRSQSVGDEINSIHGNFEVDAQYYNPDSLIGAPKVPEKVLSNVFGNLNYNRGRFSAGLRYEAYNNVMQGFDTRYKGQGI